MLSHGDFEVMVARGATQTLGRIFHPDEAEEACEPQVARLDELRERFPVRDARAKVRKIRALQGLLDGFYVGV